MKPVKHFHAPTRSLLTLAECPWCRSTMQMGEIINADQAPTDTPVWGEENIPPTYIADNGNERECCTGCGGVKFYVEKVKSDYYVISRPYMDAVPEADYKPGKSKTRAEQACNSLNSADNPVDVDDLLELTPDTESVKLHEPFVIRLGGDLSETLTRGTHIEVETDKLIEFLKQTGAKPMAATKAGLTSAKALIRELITKKKTDEAIITEVQAAFPDSAVDKKHCTKYRRELFVEGTVTAELAAVGSKEHKEWAAGNMVKAVKGPHADHWKQVKADAEAKKKADAEAKKKAAADKKAATTKKAPAKKAAK